MARMSESGEPIEPVYGPKALAGFDPNRDLGEPGAYPYHNFARYCCNRCDRRGL